MVGRKKLHLLGGLGGEKFTRACSIFRVNGSADLIPMLLEWMLLQNFLINVQRRILSLHIDSNMFLLLCFLFHYYNKRLISFWDILLSMWSNYPVLHAIYCKFMPHVLLLRHLYALAIWGMKLYSVENNKFLHLIRRVQNK